MTCPIKKLILLDFERYKLLTSANTAQVETGDNQLSQLQPRSSPVVEKIQSSILDKENILKTVSVKERNRVERLLNFIQTAEGISWNHRGQVVIDHMPLPDTHIVDLLRYNCSQNNFGNQQPPAGQQEFIKALTSKNVPLSLISNKHSQLTIQQGRGNHSSTTSSNHHSKKTEPTRKIPKKRRNNSPPGIRNLKIQSTQWLTF